MSETVYKCYLRDCGVEGKFIVLEAGKERNDNGHVCREGISIYGHYNENGTYDDTYVSQRIIEEPADYINRIIYEAYERKDKSLLTLFLSNCTFTISAPLENAVEQHSNLAKNDVYKRFLEKHDKEINTQAKLNQYGRSYDSWEKVEFSDGLATEYSDFFNDACSVLESKGFDVSGLKNQCK